jgi:hypothetical protein
VTDGVPQLEPAKHHSTTSSFELLRRGPGFESQPAHHFKSRGCLTWGDFHSSTTPSILTAVGSITGQ